MLKPVEPESFSRIRHTYAWRKLAAQVVEEEPTCRIRLPGCTGVSTCADHIKSVLVRPDLVLVRSNCQGACRHCNQVKAAGDAPNMLEPKALGFFDTSAVDDDVE